MSKKTINTLAYLFGASTVFYFGSLGLNFMPRLGGFVSAQVFAINFLSNCSILCFLVFACVFLGSFFIKALRS